MSGVVNLFVIVAVGVIIADLVYNWAGTASLLNGVGSIWATSVNGMLGNTTTVPGGSTAPAIAGGNVQAR